MARASQKKSQTQNGKTQLSFVLSLIAFVLIILSVPLVDLIRDVKEEKPIQAIGVFRDTFIQPIVRRDSIMSQFQELQKGVAVLQTASQQSSEVEGDIPNLDSLVKLSEDLYFELGDLILSLNEINPHVQIDSLGTISQSSDSLKSSWLKSIDENTPWNSSTEAIWEVFSKEISSENSNPLKLWWKSFFTHTVFNPAYLRAFESQMEDESVIANSSRKVMQRVYANVFSEYGDKALRGSDENSNEWLFYKPGVNYLVKPSVLDSRSKKVDANDTRITDNPVDIITEFRDQLQSRGIELLVMIVPTKGSIYPEYLNSCYEDQGPGQLGYTSDIIQRLKVKDIQTLDLFTLFHNLKKNPRNQSLYLKQDTHWSPFGVKNAATALSQKIKSMSWYQVPQKRHEYITQDTIVSRMGDIAEMTEIENYFPTQEVKAQRIFKISRDSLGVITSKRPYRDDHRRSRILYLGDSFSRIFQTDTPTSAGIISHLAKELGEDLSSIVSDGGASTLVRQKLARKKKLLKRKKLVIWEFVERDFRYGAEGWKRVEL